MEKELKGGKSKIRGQFRGCCSSLVYRGGSEDRAKGVNVQYLWEIKSMGLVDRFIEQSNQGDSRDSDVATE